MKKLLFFLLMILHQSVLAQMAEYYAGHKRTGVDLMWFRNFKNSKGEKSPFLYFSRNRASVDYKHAPAAMGSTNAVSYNFKNGVGLVAVASFVNTGLVPKAGVQYYRQSGNWMFFGWLVADLKEKGNVDLFGLFRYQPVVNETWKGLLQLELFPVYNPSSEFWNITQRIRIGAKKNSWGGGFMIDLNQSGTTRLTNANNTGVFLRYDF